MSAVALAAPAVVRTPRYEPGDILVSLIEQSTTVTAVGVPPGDQRVRTERTVTVLAGGDRRILGASASDLDRELPPGASLPPGHPLDVGMDASEVDASAQGLSAFAGPDGFGDEMAAMLEGMDLDIGGTDLLSVAGWRGVVVRAETELRIGASFAPIPGMPTVKMDQKVRTVVDVELQGPRAR